MNPAKELLEAIRIIVQQELKTKLCRIYIGVVTSYNSGAGTCSITVNGGSYTDVKVYGGTPTVNSKYPIFVPEGNMSAAFITA